MKQSRWRKYFFAICVGLFIFTVGFHLYEMIRFGFTGRHFLFVLINLCSAWMTYKRPKVLFPTYFFFLTLQQVFSHGGAFVSTWKTSSTIDWSSALIVLFFPILLWAAVTERPSV